MQHGGDLKAAGAKAVGQVQGAGTHLQGSVVRQLIDAAARQQRWGYLDDAAGQVVQAAGVLDGGTHGRIWGQSNQPARLVVQLGSGGQRQVAREDCQNPLVIEVAVERDNVLMGGKRAHIEGLVGQDAQAAGRRMVDLDGAAALVV